MLLLMRLQRHYKVLSNCSLAEKRSQWCTFVAPWSSCQVLNSSTGMVRRKVPPLPAAILSRGNRVQMSALFLLDVLSEIRRGTSWLDTYLACRLAYQAGCTLG